MIVSRGFSQELLDRISEQISITVQIGNVVNELMRLVAEKKELLNFLKSRLGNGKGSIFLKMVRNRKGGKVYYYYYWRIYENGKRHDIYLGKHGYDSKMLNSFAKRVNKLNHRFNEIVDITYRLTEILRELDDLAKELREYLDEEEKHRPS